MRDGKPNIDPSMRKITFAGTGDPPGDPHILGDPTATGASLQVVVHGNASSTQTFTLPASAWQRLPADPGRPLAGYTYKDVTPGLLGPVKTVVLKRSPSGTFTFRASIVGKNGPGPQPHITVTPPAPGIDGGAILTIPGGTRYCVQLGSAAGGVVENTPSPGPPTNKVFKVKRTPAAPTFEAGCTIL